MRFRANGSIKIRKVIRWPFYFVDLNRFKYINDTLGHNIGDQVLRDVSKSTYVTTLHESVDLYRFGGDEFIIVFKNLFSIDGSYRVCQ